MSGGSLAILRLPSTTSVSFAKAFRLSFDCAFATLRSKRLTCLPVACSAASATSSSTSMREYQRSRLGSAAKLLIASR